MCTVGHYRCTVCDMLTLVCTEHTSTTSPVDGTQKYDYWHEVKSTDQVWDFRDDVCRIESRNLWSWPLYMKCSHSYVRSTPQPHRQSMEHRSMTICIMIKVLIIIRRIYNFLHLVLLYNGLQFRTDLVVYRDPTKISKKISKYMYKARLEPSTFCSAYKNSDHYTTAVVSAANHYFIPNSRD